MLIYLFVCCLVTSELTAWSGVQGKDAECLVHPRLECCLCVCVSLVCHLQNPSEMLQAEDRAHRIGLKHAVNVYYMHAPDSIGERCLSFPVPAVCCLNVCQPCAKQWDLAYCRASAACPAFGHKG